MPGTIAQHVVGVPAPPLRAFVVSYVGYRYEGFRAGVHLGLPSEHLTCVVTIDDAIEVGSLDGTPAQVRRYTALLGGLDTGPVAIRHDGTQYGVQLALTPWGARAVFGTPAGVLTGKTVDLDAVVGTVATEIVERVRSAGTWAGRFAALDRVLGRMAVAAVDRPAPQLLAAWRALTRASRPVAVADLASEVGWSRQHLTARFRDECGLGPKTLARIVRFQRARRMLTRGQASLGAIAVGTGYADQAHMNRDWRQFAATSPLQWMADEELPFVQDDAHVPTPD